MTIPMLEIWEVVRSVAEKAVVWLLGLLFKRWSRPSTPSDVKLIVVNRTPAAIVTRTSYHYDGKSVTCTAEIVAIQPDLKEIAMMALFWLAWGIVVLLGLRLFSK